MIIRNSISLSSVSSSIFNIRFLEIVTKRKRSGGGINSIMLHKSLSSTRFTIKESINAGTRRILRSLDPNVNSSGCNLVGYFNNDISNNNSFWKINASIKLISFLNKRNPDTIPSGHRHNRNNSATAPRCEQITLHSANTRSEMHHSDESTTTKNRNTRVLSVSGINIGRTIRRRRCST